MKFILQALNEGKYCFIFTPALMLLCWILSLLGLLNGDTEISPTIAKLVNWRYSEASFSLFIFVSFAVSTLTIFTIRTQPIPRHEKVRLAKALGFVARLMNNMFLFWSGVFFAWSFGSRVMPFVPRMDTQEAMAIILVFVAIWFKYQIIKIKHWAVRSV